MKRERIIPFLIFVSIIILISFFIEVPKKTAAFSFYQPFGGKIEEYKEKSDAKCVKDVLDKLDEILKPINNAIQKAIYSATSALAAQACALIASPCAGAAGIGYPICYAACMGGYTAAVENTKIKLTFGGELKIGPPKPATVGILDPGISLQVVFFNINLDLSDILEKFNVKPPFLAKIYGYGYYKIKSGEENKIWALGDSFDIHQCDKIPAGTIGEPLKKICENVIVKGINQVFGDKKNEDLENKNKLDKGEMSQEDYDKAHSEYLDYINNCPLFNLLNQMGTSKKPLSISP